MGSAVIVAGQFIKYLLMMLLYELYQLLVWAVDALMFRHWEPAPVHPTLVDNFYPVADELYVESLPVEYGKVPEALDGMYIRIGPNAHFPVSETYNEFTADGMLHGIEVKGGNVSYRNRFVRTEKWIKENAAKKSLEEPIDIDKPDALLRIILRPLVSKISGHQYLDTTNIANTALEYHAGRCFALAESAKPVWVTLPDLKTVGTYSWDGAIDHNVTAHTKVDPANGNLYMYGYRLDKKPFCEYSRVSKEGKALSTIPISLDTAVYMHAFEITEHYAIIMDHSLIFKPERMLDGKSPFWFDESKPARFGIIPRESADPKNVHIKWFEADPSITFHFANAYEEGDEIVMRGCRYKVIIFPVVIADKERFMREYTPMDWISHMHEWRFNLKTGKTTERKLSDTLLEFPNINLAYSGRKNRYAFCMRFNKEDALVKLKGLDNRHDAIVKWDFKKNKETAYECPPGKFIGEGVFVPRNGGTTPDRLGKVGNAEEDDGYLTALVYDENTNNSSWVVLDAKDMSLVASVKLPRRVPYGFHGKWFSRAQINAQVPVSEDKKL